MTQSLSVASAIAMALRDAGVSIATHVPGHGATQTFAAFRAQSHDACLPISFHEEPAYAIAHGAALTGKRSACIIKSHGLTKAMNAVMDSLSCGVTAGMVVLIYEDKGGSHSDNIIEVLPIINGAEMPHAVATRETIYRDVIDAVTKSERLRLPYTLVIDSAMIEEITEFIPNNPFEDLLIPKRNKGAARRPTSVYHRDVRQHVVCPIFAPYQREVLLNKLHPSEFMEFVPQPSLPVIPDSLPLDYQRAVQPYLSLFAVFKKLDVDFVCGDAGVSTLSAFPPYEIVHAALYMGGSIPTIIGAYLAGMKKVWSFIGDFSFISAGHYGLVEALLRNAPIKVLIFANGKAQTTGGQSLDLALLEVLLKGYERYIVRLDDPFDSEATHRVLSGANDADEMRIVVAKYS